MDGAEADYRQVSALMESFEPDAPQRRATAAEATIAFTRLQYRIDTLYVFARILLDDIAVLLDRSLGTDSIGTHKGVAKNLPELAQARRVVGYQDVVSKAGALTERVRDFRDDYVVHRNINKPRALRGLTTDTDGRHRLSVGGIIDPKEGETAEYIVSDHPEELMVALYEYLESVLDLIEQYQP